MNNSSKTRQSFFIVSFSMRNCGWLLLKIMWSSVQLQRYRSEVVFYLKFPKVFCLTECQLHRSWCIGFCLVTVSCRLRIFVMFCCLLVIFTGSSYTGLGGYVTLGGGPLRKISSCVPFFWQQCEFLLLDPFLPRKSWCDCCFPQESVDIQTGFSWVSSWLLHDVLLKPIFGHLCPYWFSLSQSAQLQCDCKFIKFEFGVYFQKLKFARRLTVLISVMTFEKQDC